MKLFRAYIITVIACISISSTVACIFIADENARKISLGEDYAVVAMKNQSENERENALFPECDIVPLLYHLTALL